MESTTEKAAITNDAIALGNLKKEIATWTEHASWVTTAAETKNTEVTYLKNEL